MCEDAARCDLESEPARWAVRATRRRIPFSRGCPVGYRRAVSRPLTIAILGAVLSAKPWGCSDLLPSPDLFEIDIVEVDTAEVDVPDIGQIECQVDEDCQGFAQC